MACFSKGGNGNLAGCRGMIAVCREGGYDFEDFENGGI
jgi:hypothetical protein